MRFKLHQRFAFAAILVAGLVLFAHAALPHHHHGAIELCTEAIDMCGHSHATHPESLPQTALELPCGHCQVETCQELTSPYTPQTQKNTEEALPLFYLEAIVAATPATTITQATVLSTEVPSLISGHILSCSPRRGPPVLV